MRFSTLLHLLAAAFLVQIIVTPGLSKSVRITGRLVFPDGGTPSYAVQLSRSDDHRISETAMAGADGRFSFTVPAGQSYRIWLGSGMKTAAKVTDTASDADIDVGDMVFEYCPTRDVGIPKAPVSAPMTGHLSLDQIVIDAQPPPNGKPILVETPDPPSYESWEPPQCSFGFVSPDHREEWEKATIGPLRFDRYVSVEEFVGGKVKVIHVIRHDPNLQPEQTREEVRKVWFGIFWDAASSIGWSEGNRWNIAASVEFEDGKRTSLVMDGGVHVQVQDREGHYWYIRLWPAVD